MEKSNKIFGVGFAKTGTTTLGKCFEILGYGHVGTRLDLVYKYGDNDLQSIYDIADKYDSFEDWPWSLLYKELDEQYPYSKFILTVRETQNVLKSYKNMIANEVSRKDIKQIRKIIYGFEGIDGKEKDFIEKYERHNKDVMKYFKGREKDLLIVNWEKGDGWVQLCKFLNREKPDVPFPHCNKGLYDKNILAILKKFNKRLKIFVTFKERLY